ncbi:ComEA family DNA-binding protein [Brevibacterium oceani]|uniref:ComEA family DNA-binding protein n=1 Tax=Brevibacterium oceani TaxID=358099 RepID=UPI001B333134|nr:ComEA family DNA-binding protein [Brevibacterium oceani]
MAVSPDDRFAGLLNSSAERGGWVPGDVFTADSAGEEEVVEPRRVRLPVLVAVAIATVGILVLAFFLFRPAAQHAPTGADADEPAAGSDRTNPSTAEAGSPAGGSTGPAEGAQGVGAGGAGAASAAPSGDVIVHVTGAVKKPSVVTLKAGARVQDAVEAAGGLSNGADAESINLARVLADGEQIHIPKEGEAPPGDATADHGTEGSSADAAGVPGGGASGGVDGASGGADAASGTSGGASDAAGGAPGVGGAPGAGGKIDLNAADAAALETLPGIGPVTAEAIIAHRQSQPFASVDDLLLVKGIGPKTFESLRDLVTVG